MVCFAEREGHDEWKHDRRVDKAVGKTHVAG